MPKTDQSVRTAYLYDDDGGKIVLFILILVVPMSSFNAHILARHREIVAAEPWSWTSPFDDSGEQDRRHEHP